MDDQTIKVEAVHFDVAADEVAAGGHEVKSETQVEQVFVDCGFENGEEEGADFHESQVGTSRNTTCVPANSPKKPSGVACNFQGFPFTTLQIYEKPSFLS